MSSTGIHGIPSMVTSPDGGTGIPATAYHLNNYWTALVLESGEVLMQFRKIHIHGTGQEVDLSTLNESGNENLLSTLQHYGTERMVARCLLLEKDGAIHADSHGVSLGGQPTDTFQVFEPATEAAGWYMRVNQDVFERKLAEEMIAGK